VNPETRSRVLAAAESMGYRPNRAARALITGRTGNIGLIVADIANPFFPPLIKAAESQARQRDCHVFVADTNEDPLVEEELVQALAKQVDGIVLCSPRMSNSAIERLAHDVPLVVVNRLVAGLPAVVMDVAHGARLALEHLAEPRAPRRRPAGRAAGLLDQPRDPPGGDHDRPGGGVTLNILGPNAPTEHGGMAAAEQVRHCGAPPVLAYNDLMAIGLMEGLHTLGVDRAAGGQCRRLRRHRPVASVRPKLTTVATPDRGRRPGGRRHAAPARRRPPNHAQ
jgi:LacI family transcriptional regulator